MMTQKLTAKVQITHITPEKDEKLDRPVGKFKNKFIRLANNIRNRLSKQLERPIKALRLTGRVVREWYDCVKKRSLLEHTILIMAGVVPWILFIGVVDGSKAIKKARKKERQIKPTDMATSMNIPVNGRLIDGVHPDLLKCAEEGRIENGCMHHITNPADSY